MNGIATPFQQHFPRGSVARRLIFWIVLSIGLLALATTTLQLMLDYRQELRRLDENFHHIGEAYLPAITEGMWVADTTQLQLMLDGIHRLPDIAYAEVRDTERRFAAAGRPIPDSAMSQQWPLVRNHRGQPQRIGELTVQADLAAVRGRVSARVWVTIFVNLLMTLLVAALMFLVTHRLVTRHLEDIARHFAQARPETLGAPLHLDRRPRPDRDELDRLVAEFNRLSETISAAYGEIRELNVTLEQRVAARTAELENANRELDAFAHSVSHDLRSPLRAINGFARLLQDDERERLSENGRHMLDHIVNAGGKLDHLIDDILQYSRAGQRPLERRGVTLGHLVQEVADELHEQYPATAIAIGELPTVEADPTMLRQIWQNLIGNAFKFSAKSPAPRVEVGCRQVNGETEFFVRDNGAGFDMRYADKLFGMFQRMHGESEFPGTGVGLAIVKRLVDRHGGRIRAEAAPDAGASFYFTLGR